ncbi:hypothetical protein RUM43_002889 [Polyplax serrata]|uniref:Uncharacterized protein n=1 Tax=Polyplax serrata TaxID=468196 RepID=A0AAN8PEL3_POLSC
MCKYLRYALPSIPPPAPPPYPARSMGEILTRNSAAVKGRRGVLLSRKHAIKAPERIKKFRLTRRKIGNGEKKLWRKDERVKEEDEKEEKIKLTTS